MSAQLGQLLESFSLTGQRLLCDAAAARTKVDCVQCGGMSIPRYTNEFWTAAQRRGHSLHEISYRACFKAELPRFFITRLTEPGDCVYDPFMGRGTALLEAALLGRRCAGNDVNPLSRILIEPRLTPPELEQIDERLRAIPWQDRGKAEIDLSMFFSPATEKLLLALRRYLLERAAAGDEDAVDRWIRMVATNRLTGHSPGFFSVYTLPPNQAVSPDAQRKINAKLHQAPPDRDAPALILEKSRSLQRDLTRRGRQKLAEAAASARFFCEHAQLPTMPPESVTLAVTSPPFLDVVQYAEDNWLRCWFNGIDAGAVAARMTTARSIDDWSAEMSHVFAQLYRALVPGGWVAFEVGDVRGGRVLLDEIIAPLGASSGLTCRRILVNQQKFTKTSACWGVSNNRRGTNTNRIVLFQKAE